MPRNSAIGQSGAAVSFSGAGLGTGIDGVGLSSSFPQGRKFNNYQFQDTATYTLGRHTFRIGADLNVQRGSQAVPFNSRGIFAFTASNPVTPTAGGTPFTCPAPIHYPIAMASFFLFPIFDLNSLGVKYSKLECGLSSL